jgi:hypothetical protein
VRRAVAPVVDWLRDEADSDDEDDDDDEDEE